MPAGNLLAAAHKVIALNHISYSPQGITNAPIKIDLTAPPAVEGGGGTRGRTGARVGKEEGGRGRRRRPG